MLQWTKENLEQLPTISSDYTLPYLNEIANHPEAYERKALFLDLVITGTIYDSQTFYINDDAKLFIREQLTKNGTF